MSEAVLILRNMRGGCATVDNKVHALFRVTSRRPSQVAKPADNGTTLPDEGELISGARLAAGGD